MTRTLLSFLVSALAVTFGLVTAGVQSENHATASRLDRLKRECDRLEAEIQSLEAETMRQRYRLHHRFGDGAEDLELGVHAPEF